MEWERQRKEQLMAEKAREYEQLMALKSQTSNFTCELESLVRPLQVKKNIGVKLYIISYPSNKNFVWSTHNISEAS